MVIVVFKEENSWCLSYCLKSLLEHCGWEIKNSPVLSVWGVGEGDVLGGSGRSPRCRGLAGEVATLRQGDGEEGQGQRYQD